ncbi:MAG TPA: radical SAM protein [Gemmatimonadaceae bacterium]|nr:radical SAM protein [Gemmatimonadaceae bacterium]
MSHTPLFSDPRIPPSRTLPVIGSQKDIVYHAASARRVLNAPETTGMGFWSINPYTGCAFGCAYCYARYAHRYFVERSATSGALEDGEREAVESLPPWLAFERRIFVKENAADSLRRELVRGGARYRGLFEGESIVIGTATDPYQPAERRYRVTRGVLEVLAEHTGLRVVVITKSPLITRDIDVLSRIMVRSRLSIHLSLITLDRELARRLEPRAPTPEARLRALARLREAGIDAGINCMPVLPGITDDPFALEALVRRAAEAGATYVGACALRLQSAARQRYLPFIENEFPHLAERYRSSYASSPLVSETYREGLSRFFAGLRRRYGIPESSRFGEDEEGQLPAKVREGDDQLKLL